MLSMSPDEISAKLEIWLKDKLSTADVKVLELKDKSGAGFSAETFYADIEFTKAGQHKAMSIVVRCQNQDNDLFVDASIALPYNVMEAVAANSSIPVPGLVGLEMDDSVLGLPFLVMEKMPGRIVQQSPNYNGQGWVKDLPPEQRGEVWNSGIDIIAQVNSLDWEQGFGFLVEAKYGEPGIKSYIAWVKEWYQWARGNPIPLMDLAFQKLMDDMPEDAPVNVLWGDPNPGNILFADDLSVEVVLDWELANLGPAEIDIAWWLFFDDLFSHGMGMARLEGLPDRETTIRYYESKLGRKVENMEYYNLLATFRMAIVGMRSVDRQIELGTIPSTSNARSNQPIMCLLAKQLGQPEPEVGEDFAVFSKAIGLS